MNPLVSVVIPAYNAAKYLPEALDSVFQQTYAPIEVIVVDDGSTDNTASLLVEYGTRIKLICKPNGGIGSARNAGMRAATGSMIAFLDADDIWLSHKIEYQVAIMCDDVMMCGSSGSETDPNGTQVRLERYHNMLVNNPFSASSVMILAKCLARVGNFVQDRRYHGVEDWDMWLRISAGYKVLYAARKIVDIRCVSDSVSSLPNTTPMLNAELAVIERQMSGVAEIKPGKLLVRRAIGYRYFCAAWGELMLGNRRQARAYILSSLMYYPVNLFYRKPLALLMRILRESVVRCSALPSTSADF